MAPASGTGRSAWPSLLLLLGEGPSGVPGARRPLVTAASPRWTSQRGRSRPSSCRQLRRLTNRRAARAGARLLPSPPGLLAAAAAPAAAFNCKLGCPAASQPVCGANGVSYMSACVAACSGGQQRTAPGYCPGAAPPCMPAAAPAKNCPVLAMLRQVPDGARAPESSALPARPSPPHARHLAAALHHPRIACASDCPPHGAPARPHAGDKLRFAPPGAGSATALAKERAVLVPPAVMAKFAQQGFSYVGHAPLSNAPLRRKVAWIKEAAFKAAAAARSAGTAAATRLAGVAADRSSAAGKAAAAPAPPIDTSGALDSVSSFQPATSSGQQMKVEVVRGDRFGNVYYKT